MTSEKVSDLPTLWVYGPSLTQAMATPADRVARVSAFLRRDHDESREHEFVPAARLDAANLEIARLKGVMRRVAASMGHSGGETPEYLPCNESCVDCDEDTIAETHRPDLPADCCSDHPDADGEIDCWRCLLTAALTPKEPSDE